MSVAEGTHQMHVVDYGTSETKAGLPQIAVVLANDEGDKITWFGSLKTDQSSQITVDTLKRMGVPNDQLNDVAKGKDVAPNVSFHAALDVEVAEETYQGVTRPKVKWVNKVGEGGGPGVKFSKEAVARVPDLKRFGLQSTVKDTDGIPF